MGKLLISLFAPPCGGKGTIARILEECGFTVVRASKVLAGVPVAREYMDSGVLVPPNIAIPPLIAAAKAAGNQAVFDGIPRDSAQYEAVREALSSDCRLLLFAIDVPEDELVQRASVRVVCSDCGNPGAINGTIPMCCGRYMARRTDDDAILKRITEYHEETEPVFKEALRDGIGIRVDGSRGSQYAAKIILQVATKFAL